MTAYVFGHPLSILRDGVAAFVGGERRAAPAMATGIDVSLRRGRATVAVRRFLRNNEQVPIQAALIFAVACDAAPTNLAVKIDGRECAAIAQPQAASADAHPPGKTVILHKEALHGLHVLCIGHLGPGMEAEATVEMVMPLTLASGRALLRIPATPRQIHGASLLPPGEDVVPPADYLASDAVAPGRRGVLTVSCDCGVALLDGVPVGEGPCEVALDRAIEIVFPGAYFGLGEGGDAQGHVACAPEPGGVAGLRRAFVARAETALRPLAQNAFPGRDGGAETLRARPD